MENFNILSLKDNQLVPLDMAFDFDDDNMDNNLPRQNEEENTPNDNNQNGGGKKPPKNRKNLITVLILAIVFVVIVILMLYFFVFRNQSTERKFSDTNSIQYHVYDYNEKGEKLYYKVDPTTGEITTTTEVTDTPAEGALYRVDENGNIYSTYNENVLNKDMQYTFSDFVMDIENGRNKFELSYILMSPSLGLDNSPIQYRNLKVSTTLSNKTSRLIVVSGTYQEYVVETKKSKNYKFSCQMDYDDYLKYIKPILDYTVVSAKDKDGQTYRTKYYSIEHNTYSGLDIQSENNIMSWLLPLLMIAAMVIFFVYMFKMSRGGDGNPMSGFTNNLGKKAAKSTTKFSDVAGCDEVKAELEETIDYFKNTDKYTRLGAKLPHGLLLQGPPGTGKTLLAKAVAGEADVPFFSISGSDFVEMYVGVGASRVRSLFKTAKQNAPCLIFIDEIDAVGRQRGTGLGGGNDEREQTLNELLVEMDGFEDNNGIIVIAATNRSDVLDPALTRPGRFDRTITVDLPDKEGRAAILKVHSRNKKLAADVSFESIASRTVGFAGADLANIMNEAAIMAVRNNRSVITTADIDEAIDRAIAGPAKKSHLEDDEKKQVAYHESGHAVVGLFLPYSDKVQKITIIPRGRTGGHVLMTPEKDRFLMTKNQLLSRITGYLGGRTSEEIFFGDVSTGASNDIEVATNIARSMVTEYGMSELGPIQYESSGGDVFLGRDYTSSRANYSTQIAFEIDKEIRKIVEGCHAQCRELLEQHKDDVELIAKTLIENETITADQIQYLLEHRELPKVDEHKLEDELKCKNPNCVILKPEFIHHYQALDTMVFQKASRIVVVVESKNEADVVENEKFVKLCKAGAKDASRIAMYFIDAETIEKTSMKTVDFVSHLKAYCNIDLISVEANQESFDRLQQKYSRNPKNAPTERKGVVNEIIHHENIEVKDEVKDDTSKPNSEVETSSKVDENKTDTSKVNDVDDKPENSQEEKGE